MQTTYPFDLILFRLEQLQSSVNILSENAQEVTPAQSAGYDRLLDLSEAEEARYVRIHDTFVEYQKKFISHLITEQRTLILKVTKWGSISNVYLVIATKNGEISEKVSKKIIYDN